MSNQQISTPENNPEDLKAQFEEAIESMEIKGMDPTVTDGQMMLDIWKKKLRREFEECPKLGLIVVQAISTLGIVKGYHQNPRVIKHLSTVQKVASDQKAGHVKWA